MEKQRRQQRWLHTLWLLTLFLAVPSGVLADVNNAGSYFKVTNTVLSIERPYIELEYADYDFNNDDDALKNATFFLCLSTGTELEVASMSRCHDNMLRYNSLYGRMTVVKEWNREPRIVQLRFYPSQQAILDGIAGFRHKGRWDIDDDNGDGYDVNEYRSFTAGYEFSAPSATFKRTAPGKIQASMSGLPQYTGSDSYESRYYFSSSAGYSANADYGKFTTKASAGTMELTRTVSNRNAVTIHYYGAAGKEFSILKNSINAQENDDKTVASQFYGRQYTEVIPGCAYPSDVKATADMWTKKVTLSWKANTSGLNTSGKWYIYRYEKSAGVSSRQQIGSVAVSTTTYTDPNAVPDYDKEYIYEVSFGLTDWNISEPVGDLTASSSVTVKREFAMGLSLKPETDHIVLNWGHQAIPGNGVFTFKVLCSENGGSWKELGQVQRSSTEATSHSYTHTGLSNGCTTYNYKVQITLMDKDFYSDEKSGSITGSSHVTGLTASKGTYANMVKLSWVAEQIGTSPTKYILYRRILGSGSSWSKIYNTSGTSDNYYFEDNTASPGQYYEYQVASSYNCDGKETTPIYVLDNGFSQATGTVSGRITYGSGTAVEGVRVVLTKNSDDEQSAAQFHALRVDGLGGGVKTALTNDEAAALYGGGKPFSVQLWANLDASVVADNGGVSRPMIIDVFNGFSLFAEQAGADRYQVVLRMPQGTAGGTDRRTGIYMIPGRYHHFTLTYDGMGKWTLFHIKEDGKAEQFSASSTATLSVSQRTPDISFGTNLANAATYTFKGYVDEIRLWGTELGEADILKNYDRPLTGSEKALRLYWPLDEGILNQRIAYDYSQTGGVANGLHGNICEGSKSSDVVPDPDQLSLYGLTDVQGNYVIRGVPFSGRGTNYVITPSMGVHEFSPKYVTRYVNANSLNHSGVDLQDVSSFEVSGTVYYENTTYPVANCNFYIDGNICYKDGEPIVTDSKGQFTINVPIGDHFVEVRKQGHSFAAAGRYPADPNGLGLKQTFDRPVSGLSFTDVTKVTVAGRIVGGTVEAGKPLGFGKSTANIGKAIVKLKTGYKMNMRKQTDGGAVEMVEGTTPLVYAAGTENVNSKVYAGAGDDESVRTITVETDPATGEFAAQLPPVEYRVEKVTIPSAPEIVFANENIPAINATNPLYQLKDSAVNEQGKCEYFSYAAALRLTHRVTPSFSVSHNDDGSFGEKTYVYKDLENPQGTDVSLYSIGDDKQVSYTFGYPVFVQFHSYDFRLKAYEEYVNKDDQAQPVIDRVPLSKSVVTITNQFAAGQKVYVEGANDGQFVDSELAENQLTLDSLGTATYRFIAGYPNIQEPYTLGLNIRYEANGENLGWSGNGTFKAVVLGALPSGNNFVTSGPDKVLMVLRDPPGSNSQAFYEKGTMISETNNDGGSFITSNEITTLTKLGVQYGTIQGTPGFGVITDLKANVDLEVGLNVNVEYSGSKGWSTTTTTTDKIYTSDSPDYVGAIGDVFVGSATNLLFGNARNVDIRKEAGGTFVINKKDAITTSTEFSTGFKYTQFYVENTLLPNLLLNRNALLQTVGSVNVENTTDEPIYVTTLQPGDERFGTNNFDEVWGTDAVPRNNLSGPSYTMILPKKMDPGKIYSDKIRWYNTQIEMWKKTLADNEKSKVQAIEDRERWLVQNHSFDAGTAIESSTQTCHTDFTEHQYTVETLAVFGLASGTTINGTGVAGSFKTTTGGRSFGSREDSEETCNTIGYTLKESGINDALTVDVFTAPDGFGPIFRTRGGQTSAPYEGQTLTGYYRPGTEISAATMQVEMPRISVVNAYATGVPSGKAASYTLELKNLSETNDDVYFDLALIDESNPHGAKLSIDGAVLTDGRAILVKAGETLHKTLQLTQTDLGVLDYENIKLVLKSQEQGDPTSNFGAIADTVDITANFVPACSDIAIQMEQRIVNTHTGTLLPIVVKNYDRSYRSFKGVRLQYKGEADADWQLIKEYVADEKDKKETNELLKESSISHLFDMSNSALYPDQNYLFRAITVCDFGSGEVNNESEEIAVVKDVNIPQALGNPVPVNGILTADGELSVTFNENIKSAELTDAGNFSVKGQLNGYKVGHAVALKLNAGNSAATEAEIDLAKRPFAVNLWMKYQTPGTVVAQRSAAGGWAAKIDAGGHLVMTVGNSEYVSTETLPRDKWLFLTLAYSYQEGNSTINAHYAQDANEVTLFNNQKVADYAGKGRIAVGGTTFEGAVHELTLWNEARTFAEARSGMYTAKTATTPGLIGYWKMDEGNGVKAADAARNRHIMLPAANDWYFQTPNKALVLNGAEAVGINTSACTTATNENYLVELWFKAGKQNAEAALMSVDDTVLNVHFDAAGALCLQTGNTVTPLSGGAAWADNAWHHLALNVIKGGYTTVYIDGTAAGQIASAGVPALASDRIILGAARYKAAGTTGEYAYKHHFKGGIDEFRLWRASRTVEMIRAQRFQRMEGTESGLAAYYPFETSQVDQFNQTVVVADYADHSSGKAGQADHAAETAIGDDAPGLKEAPLMENVNFTYVASERKVVISINEPASRIEGCTLQFTVKNVRDANNNLSQPVTWTAYVSRNQLNWAEQSFSMRKEVTEPAVFEVEIANTGGDVQNWALEGMPSWLAVSSASGTLKPLSSKRLVFTIGKDLPIGRYEQTVYLTGNDEIAEPMVLSLVVTGNEPDWTVNPEYSEWSMNIMGQLRIEGVLSENPDDKVAAFIGERCVGVASPRYNARYDSYFTMLDIYGNADDKDKNVAFKVWDASTGSVRPAVTTDAVVNFANDAVLGTAEAPFKWNAANTIEQILPLNEGWKWISLYVEPADAQLGQLLETVKPVSVVIKNKAAFSVPDGTGWSGSLQTMAVGEMYKIRLKEAATLVVSGVPVVAAEKELTVRPNWNWLGVNAAYTMPLKDAFAGISPEKNDVVKCQSGFAIYNGSEWVGSLEAIVPGNGVMYRSKAAGDKVFCYPALSAVKRMPRKIARRAPGSAFTPVDNNAYPGNMTFVAMVRQGTEPVIDCEVGVFAGEECRGVARPDSSGLLFLMAAGEGHGTPLTFKVSTPGGIQELNTGMVYSDDAAWGTLNEPYILQLGSATGIDGVAGGLEVYPLKVRDVLHVNSVAGTVNRIIITDLNGRKMYDDAAPRERNEISFAALTQGLYIVTVHTGDGRKYVYRVTK